MARFSDLQMDCPELISIGLFPILPLLDIPDTNRIAKYYEITPLHKLNHIELTQSQIICDCRCFCKDIFCNTQFDVLFSHHVVENFAYTKAVLYYVSVNRSYETDHLPNGYSGICIIDFPDGKPELLNKLRPENEKNDLSKYDRLYLTNKTVYDKIMFKLNNQYK